jgi:hypothetical protein
MSREAADKAEQSERPRTFGKRRLRNVGNDGSEASMLSARNVSMVASFVYKTTTTNRGWSSSRAAALAELTSWHTESGSSSPALGYPRYA